MFQCLPCHCNLVILGDTFKANHKGDHVGLKVRERVEGKSSIGHSHSPSAVSWRRGPRFPGPRCGLCGRSPRGCRSWPTRPLCDLVARHRKQMRRAESQRATETHPTVCAWTRTRISLPRHFNYPPVYLDPPWCSRSNRYKNVPSCSSPRVGRNSHAV